MKTTLIQEITEKINQIQSDEEYTAIYNALKAKREYMMQIKTLSFAIGDQVMFDAGRKGIIYGIVTNIKKNFKIKSEGNVSWNVHPSFVKKPDKEVKLIPAFK